MKRLVSKGSLIAGAVFAVFAVFACAGMAGAVVSYITEDTEVWHENPNTNYSGEPDLWFGYLWGHSFRSLLKVDVPAQPVTDAKLYVYLEQMLDSNPGYVRVARVTNDWVVGEATWNERSTGVAWNTAGGDYDTNYIAGSAHSAPLTPGYVEYDITSVVQDWQNAVHPNYGLLLRELYPTGGFNGVSSEDTRGIGPYVVFEVVPEPASLLALAAGVTGLMGFALRRRTA